MDIIYNRPQDKERVKESLRSNNISVAGKMILKLAKKVGKGWFSLLLSEMLHKSSPIPKYIIQAISFVANSLSDPAIMRMGLFRVSEQVLGNDIYSQFPNRDELEGMPPLEFIDMFMKKAPNDDFSIFMKYLSNYRSQ